MNENAKKLVVALRSGEYQQAFGRLRDSNLGGGKSYCCLGVACDIYAKELGHPWNGDEYFDQFGVLPDPVRMWLGVRTNTCMYGASIIRTLTDDNDGGKSFQEIADIIEAEPPGLFVED